MKYPLSKYVVKDPDGLPVTLLGEGRDRWGLTHADRQRMSTYEFECLITCRSIDGFGPLADTYRAGVDGIDMSLFYRALKEEMEEFNQSKLCNHSNNYA